MKIFMIGGTGLLGSEPLGVQPDDIDAAIGDSIQLCMDVVNNKVQVMNMKGE